MKKILIVDDEQSFLLSLKDGLKKHAETFQVLLADNGRKAVDLLRTTAVDLLVTDLKMPEMNGFDLLAWISRHKPQLPVIVMSAFGTPEIEARLDRYDTLQFLEKPLDLKMLEEGIFNGLRAQGKSYIRGISLATFLQLMKVEQKNCTLKVTAGGSPAFLYINRGDLIDAEYESLKGMDAALEIVSWADAEIEMDGICRRSDDVVKMPMEQLLIEAFKRKDEEAEKKKMEAEGALERKSASGDVPQRASRDHSSDDPGLNRLAAVLKKLVAVQDYVIYDQGGAVTGKGPEKMPLSGIDPEEIERLLEGLPEQLNMGRFRSMVLNTANRCRYLLFYNGRQRVLIRLKPGIQAHQVIREIKRSVER